MTLTKGTVFSVILVFRFELSGKILTPITMRESKLFYAQFQRIIGLPRIGISEKMQITNESKGNRYHSKIAIYNNENVNQIEQDQSGLQRFEINGRVEKQMRIVTACTNLFCF